MTNLLQTPKPAGGFKFIFADPPWRFVQHGGRETVPQRAFERHYETMKIDDLKRLPVDLMASKDSVLLIWTTSHNLAECLEVGKAWGFTFKSLGFIWCKITTPKFPRRKAELREAVDSLIDLAWYVIKPLMGRGFWIRQEAEICLVFTRGKPKRLSAGVRQMIFAKRREHSRKPDEAYHRAMKLAAGPYLELFGRGPRAGWTVWGDETEKFEAAE